MKFLIVGLIANFRSSNINTNFHIQAFSVQFTSITTNIP